MLSTASRRRRSVSLVSPSRKALLDLCALSWTFARFAIMAVATAAPCILPRQHRSLLPWGLLPWGPQQTPGCKFLAKVSAGTDRSPLGPTRPERAAQEHAGPKGLMSREVAAVKKLDQNQGQNTKQNTNYDQIASFFRTQFLKRSLLSPPRKTLGLSSQ